MRTRPGSRPSATTASSTASKVARTPAPAPAPASGSCVRTSSGVATDNTPSQRTPSAILVSPTSADRKPRSLRVRFRRDRARTEQEMQLRSFLRLALLALVLFGLARPATAVAEDPPFVGWSALLPGLSLPYDTTSPDDCIAGRTQCVDRVVRQMTKRLQPLASSCDHDADLFPHLPPRHRGVPADDRSAVLRRHVVRES